ncbi:MAG: hypothetical protein ACRDP5_09195 [Streptosporangiaceae bacterium]
MLGFDRDVNRATAARDGWRAPGSLREAKTGSQPGELGQSRPGFVSASAEAADRGGRPAARGEQVTGRERRLGSGQLGFGTILMEPLPAESGDRAVQFADRVRGQAGCDKRTGSVSLQDRHVARCRAAIDGSRFIEQMQRGGDITAQQLAVPEIMRRLRRYELEASRDRDIT